MTNKISDLKEVRKLGQFQKLKRLTLVNNPVTEAVNYRKYVIAYIPSLLILDFNRITSAERKFA